MDKREILLFKKGYRITESGEIVNPKGKIIKGYKNKYVFIQYIVNGQKKKCAAHRLQAYQKYGLKLYTKGVEVRHLNGNSFDNSFSNIDIGSHSENMLDIPRHVRLKYSIHASSFNKKYDKTKVKVFHVKNGNSYKKTMDHFKISSKGTLNYILNH